MIVEAVPGTDRDAVVDVLTDAFLDYPVMRYVLGPRQDHASELARLIEVFVRGRFDRAGPVLGVRDGEGRWLAVATVSGPDDRPASEDFRLWREARWAELGEDARDRYDRFDASSDPWEPAERHHHLNMIGVRRSRQGQGLARLLLEAVHALAASDFASAGVTLTTELAPNVALYERFGYRVIGHARLDPALESWGMFRPVSASEAPRAFRPPTPGA